ncbi:MAG: SURF1 family protein [Pseudomonadota bacterium]
MTFRPAPWLTLFTVLGLIVLVNLGVWQMRRLDWKEDLIETVERRMSSAPVALDGALNASSGGAGVAYLPMTASGVYLHDREQHLFRTRDGAPGYEVITPLRLADGRHVLVNRGFVPQPLKAPADRPETLLEGEVNVSGLLLETEQVPAIASLFRPANQPEDNLWFVRDIPALSAAAGVEVQPFVLASNGAEAMGPWPKGGAARASFPNRHFEYAMTWFGLALTLVGVYIAFHAKAGRLKM